MGVRTTYFINFIFCVDYRIHSGSKINYEIFKGAIFVKNTFYLNCKLIISLLTNRNVSLKKWWPF